MLYHTLKQTGAVLSVLALCASADAQALNALPPAGYSMPTPTLVTEADGSHVQGSICRTATAPIDRPRWIVVTYQGGRDVEDTIRFGIRGDPLAGRTAHCAFYDERIPWRLARTDRVDVCAKIDRDFIERCVTAHT
jgi:hypothetical protein